MSTVSQPLSYLFSAFFEDDSVISQTADDKSETKEGATAFYDVQEKQKKSPLKQFSLVGQGSEGQQNLIITDLSSGRFFVNGMDFSLDEWDDQITDRKIVYWREVLTHQTAENGTEEPYISRYFIGYEGKDANGKNVQKVINVEA
jgi:hypothetical protein